MQAQSGSGDGYDYVINQDDTNTITISEYTGPDGAVTIPTNINGLLVTSLEGPIEFVSEDPGNVYDQVFYDNVTSVMIPGSVTNVGAFAFFDCPSLTNATLANGITTIGACTFQYCTSLTNVTIPASINSIGFGAFGNCTSLTNVMIPGSVNAIGFGPFAGCTSMTAIMVDPGNLFYCSVDGVLFDYNLATLIQYPGAVTGGYTIRGSVTSIGESAFYECGNLTSITIPDSVTSIGEQAFAYCSNLTSVTIPNSVKSIGWGGFGGCYSLTNLTIGNGVTNIDGIAFAGCNILSNVYFTGNAPTIDTNLDDAVFGTETPTVYYLPGTTGWSDFSASTGLPVVLWNPVIQTDGVDFGVQTNQFGFIITDTNNLTVVVEACTNLASPVWTPLQTVTLTNGSFYFSDPQWTNYPARYYGLGFP